MSFPLFHLRQRSLARANLLVAASLALMFWLSDFPHNRATPLLIVPVLGTLLGTTETARCLQRRWNLYHGGIILCLYMDLMAVALALFALLYPYLLRVAPAR